MSELHISVLPTRPTLTAQVLGDCHVCDGARVVPVPDDHENSGFRDCPTCAAYFERARLFSAGNLPARFVEASFEQFDCQRPAQPDHRQKLWLAVERLKGFVFTPRRDWLLLCGPTGTGKTHLLCAVAREATVQCGVAVRYLAMTDVFTGLKEAGQAGEAAYYRDLFQVVSQVPILLLDEIGAGRTDGEVALTSRMICRRYDADLPLLGATNYFPRGQGDLALAGRLYDTATSRLLGAEALPVLGDDIRARRP